MFQCIVASQQNHIETNWKCEQIDETWLENKVDLSDLTFRTASNGLQHLKALAPLPCPQPLQPSVIKLALSCSKLFAIDGFVRIVMYHMESLSHHITPINLARNHQKPTISYNIIQYKFIQYLISSYFIWTWKEMTGWKMLEIHQEELAQCWHLASAGSGAGSAGTCWSESWFGSSHPGNLHIMLCETISIIFYGNPKVSTPLFIQAQEDRIKWNIMELP